MNAEMIQALDEKWDKIVDSLPQDALKKLMDLPEDQITSDKLIEIINESGIDLEAVLSNKEDDGKLPNSVEWQGAPEKEANSANVKEKYKAFKAAVRTAIVVLVAPVALGVYSRKTGKGDEGPAKLPTELSSEINQSGEGPLDDVGSGYDMLVEPQPMPEYGSGHDMLVEPEPMPEYRSGFGRSAETPETPPEPMKVPPEIIAKLDVPTEPTYVAPEPRVEAEVKEPDSYLDQAINEILATSPKETEEQKAGEPVEEEPSVDGETGELQIDHSEPEFKVPEGKEAPEYEIGTPIAVPNDAREIQVDPNITIGVPLPEPMVPDGKEAPEFNPGTPIAITNEAREVYVDPNIAIGMPRREPEIINSMPLPDPDTAIGIPQAPPENMESANQ